MAEGIQSILCYNEAEAFVEGLRAHQIKDIGSDKWNMQRDHVDKLNIQVYTSRVCLHSGIFLCLHAGVCVFIQAFTGCLRVLEFLTIVNETNCL